MTTLVIKRINFVATPPDPTLALKDVSHVGNPDLFRESLWDLLLAIGFARKIAKLWVHWSITGHTLYTGLPETGSAFHQGFPARPPKGSYDWYTVHNGSPPLQPYASPAVYPEIPDGSAHERTSRQTQEEGSQ